MEKRWWIRLLAISLAFALAACGDDDDDDVVVLPDAAADTPDAPPTPDADPNQPDAAAAPACAQAALAPINDGTGQPAGGINELIISEVSPDNDFVEVYNTTDAPIDLTTRAGHKWCTFPSYADVGSDAVTVPAKGYATIPFPISATNGELVLYKDLNYGSASSVLDYVCWGSGSMRKGTAEAAGKWTGVCHAGIQAGGSLTRDLASAGTSAGDYTDTATPTPETCTTL